MTVKSSTMDTTAMELSFWKEEPLSPGFCGLDGDVWTLVEEDVAEQTECDLSKSIPKESRKNQGAWLPDSPGDSCDSIFEPSSSLPLSARAQLASKILQDLDDVLVKDEPFADWYETKTDLPMFEELPSPPAKEHQESQSRPFAGVGGNLGLMAFAPAPPGAVAVHDDDDHPHHHIGTLISLPLNNTLVTAVAAPTDTQTLLQEFEYVYGEVEQSHGTLTPPQSPPHNSSPVPVATYHHRPAAMPVDAAPLALQHLHDDFPGGMTPNPELLAEVDEIVRSRVAEWSSRPASPCTSSNSSFASDEVASSPSSSPAAVASPPPTPETDDDPDWVPSEGDGDARRPAPGKAQRRQRGARRGAASADAQHAQHAQPYATDDRRMRKKEQNKNAATRYRMKKKAEVEVILGEESELRDKNRELQDKVNDLSQEIRYLKNLMRDVFRAKGLIK